MRFHFSGSCSSLFLYKDHLPLTESLIKSNKNECLIEITLGHERIRIPSFNITCDVIIPFQLSRFHCLCSDLRLGGISW